MPLAWKLSVLATLHSAAVVGVDAAPVEVEVDVSFGLPSFTVVGLPDSSVRESRDRVRSAIRQAGFEFPAHRVTVNLAPADIRKSGTSFDLPIAIGVLAAAGLLPREPLDTLLLVGGLSLDGRVRSVRGILPIALLAAKRDARLVLPEVNAAEGAAVGSVGLMVAHDLGQVATWLANGRPAASPAPSSAPAIQPRATDRVDLADVRGQPVARRALEIAAAGRHHLLLIGPPGAGKTLLARRLPGILPPPSMAERVGATTIHSVAGLLDADSGLLAERPFRAPHHTVSAAALVGGGSEPRPGEVSLAHNGVLFLDEIVEFDRRTLDTLREPLEEGSVRITRVARAVRFPARFLLVGAMNPCPCGYAGIDERCRCREPEITRYQRRLSGPLRDRIDITIRVEATSFQSLVSNVAAESSAAVAGRVAAASARQRARYQAHPDRTNADLSGPALRQHCGLDRESVLLLERAVRRLRLTGRGYDRVRRVARTIADLEGAHSISKAHLAEALQYRALA